MPNDQSPGEAKPLGGPYHLMYAGDLYVNTRLLAQMIGAARDAVHASRPRGPLWGRDHNKEVA